MEHRMECHSICQFHGLRQGIWQYPSACNVEYHGSLPNTRQNRIHHKDALSGLPNQIDLWHQLHGQLPTTGVRQWCLLLVFPHLFWCVSTGWWKRPPLPPTGDCFGHLKSLSKIYTLQMTSHSGLIVSNISLERQPTKQIMAARYVSTSTLSRQISWRLRTKQTKGDNWKQHSRGSLGICLPWQLDLSRWAFNIWCGEQNSKSKSGFRKPEEQMEGISHQHQDPNQDI